MDNKIRLSLCQISVVNDKAENLRKAETMVTQAANEGAKIAVLPEMFNCPYQSELFPKYAEVYPEGETISLLSKLAKSKNIIIVGGSVPERDGDKIYNTSFIFDSSGLLVGRHRKVHLFDVDIKDGTVFKESDTLTAGSDVTVVDQGGIVFGVGICYDIRFTEMARKMTDKGAKILIYPAAFGTVTGPAHWELLMRSRAVDNQVFVIGAAPAKTPGAQYQAYGHSIAVDPWGRVLSQATDSEVMVTVEINFGLIEKVREELPILKHRRKDVYSY